mgnify:CR=1 FL=1
MSEKKKCLTAKQYLSQLEMIDVFINQDLERLSEMKNSATCIGSFDYSKERVQTSSTGDRLCADVARYVDFNQHINGEIDRFVNAKNQIIEEIRELRNVDYMNVLFKVYVQFKNLKATAAEMNRSYNCIIEVHKKALIAFEELHKNLTYLC